MMPLRKPSFELAELIGCPAEDSKRRCEADGFSVKIVDMDWLEAHNNGQVPTTADLRLNRIRLMTRAGRVLEAHQG